MKITRTGQVYQEGVELQQTYSPLGMLVFYNEKQYYVHNLVAQHYLEGYKPFLTVRHINGDITDNRVENLELYSPSEDIKVFEKGSRWIILEHKKTKERHKFKSLKEASEFLGYERTYLEMWFYRTKSEQLSWHHEYTIVDIAPKDKRIINRSGKYIKIKNKTTGEVAEFTSLSKASLFIGKNRYYLSERIREYNNLPENSDFEILEING